MRVRAAALRLPIVVLAGARPRCPCTWLGLGAVRLRSRARAPERALPACATAPDRIAELLDRLSGGGTGSAAGANGTRAQGQSAQGGGAQRADDTTAASSRTSGAPPVRRTREQLRHLSYEQLIDLVLELQSSVSVMHDSQ